MYTTNGLSSSVSDQFLYQAAAFEREERNAINRLSMVPRIAGVRFNRMINGTLMVPLGWMEEQNAGMFVKKTPAIGSRIDAIERGQFESHSMSSDK